MKLFKRIVEKNNSYIIKFFPLRAFLYRTAKEYKSKKIGYLLTAVGIKLFGSYTTNQSISIHKFFVPELLYLLDKFNFSKKLIQDIIDNTWVKYTLENDQENILNPTLISKNMDVELKRYQEDFVLSYETIKRSYNLNGVILSFEQGLGKTLTALAIACGLNKKHIYIFCPKSTIHNVWEHHINTFYKNEQKIFVINRDFLNTSYKFYIINYEAIPKIQNHITANSKDAILIVDESHNFLRSKSNRTSNLIDIARSSNLKDILLLSGTPLKALGNEIMPMLQILDPLFDEEAISIFKKSFGVNIGVANDILKNRLNIIMYRKLKKEVLSLPEKNEIIKNIKMPNENNYTIDTVKKNSIAFAKERYKFHKSRMSEYEQMMYTVLEYLDNKSILQNDKEFEQYKQNIKKLHKKVPSMLNSSDKKIIIWCNDYERTKILPILPKQYLKIFKECKSAYKYLNLKIKGEVIGMYLTKLRIQMTSELLQYANIDNIINESEKKTIVFTSYVDTIDTAYKFLNEKKFNAIKIHGSTKSSVEKDLNEFKTNIEVNPLIASIQMLMTGVTLIEANTIIFLNKPYRYVEYSQASDRIHRIGQDTDVFIYTLLLDTGSIGNLSTRMEDIMSWSKEQFDELVGI